MSADEPAIDTEQLPIGRRGLVMTRFSTVRGVTRAPAFACSVEVAEGCYMRVPDGCLIEVGQAKVRLAERAPAGTEAGRADGR
jgi:hypothetical protein